MYAIPLVVLAAGESKRLGRPKQLLELNGETLIERIIRVGTESPCSHVIVILGSHVEQIRERIKKNSKTVLVQNDLWQEGMSSSLRCAVNYIEQNLPESSACIFSTCDQPCLDARHLEKLIENQNEKDQIVASAYANTKGVPALFKSCVFKSIAQLNGEQGAKSLIHGGLYRVSTVDFPNGQIDIDTESEWSAITKPVN